MISRKNNNIIRKKMKKINEKLIIFFFKKLKFNINFIFKVQIYEIYFMNLPSTEMKLILKELGSEYCFIMNRIL